MGKAWRGLSIRWALLPVSQGQALDSFARIATLGEAGYDEGRLCWGAFGQGIAWQGLIETMDGAPEAILWRTSIAHRIERPLHAF